VRLRHLLGAVGGERLDGLVCDAPAALLGEPRGEVGVAREALGEADEVRAEAREV
jgi:hypothetical protein